MSDTTQPDKAQPQPATADTALQLDEAIAALQAVVTAQKAQIDALLVSLESLLAAIPADGAEERPTRPIPAVEREASGECSGLLGHPQDQRFAALHQLMARLGSVTHRRAVTTGRARGGAL